MVARRWLDIFDYISRSLCHRHKSPRVFIVDFNTHVYPFIFVQSKQIILAINFEIGVKCENMMMEHHQMRHYMHHQRFDKSQVPLGFWIERASESEP